MFTKLICALIRHRYFKERRLGKDTLKVGCTRCGQSWAMHHPMQALVPWDAELEEMYAPGGMLYEELK